MNCQHPPIAGTTACAVCPAPVDWREAALCRQADPDAWWPILTNGVLPPEAVQAVRICHTCPVRPYCLEDGWDEDDGIWAGYGPAERDRLRGKYPNATRPQRRALGANVQPSEQAQQPKQKRVYATRNRPMPEEYVTRCPTCGAWMIGKCTTQHDKEGQLNGTPLRAGHGQPNR